MNPVKILFFAIFFINLNFNLVLFFIIYINFLFFLYGLRIDTDVWIHNHNFIFVLRLPTIFQELVLLADSIKKPDYKSGLFFLNYHYDKFQNRFENYLPENKLIPTKQTELLSHLPGVGE